MIMRLFKITRLQFIFILSSPCSWSTASSSQDFPRKICSTDMHAKVEGQLVDARANWRSLLQHHKAFAPCDDGALAEDYSDAVASLLAQSQEQFTALKTLVKEHPDFLKWVLQHVDSSVSSDDLEKVIKNGESCAKTSELATLCSSIKQKAKSALAELSPVESRTYAK